MSAHLKYRSDIDGLRAIAVLSVVAYHLDHRLAPGGYIGVDIFFVISGYLIGSILLKEFDAGTFSFARFFERRIRRLFPAYFVMALATASVSWVVLMPEAYRQFGQSLFAATVFISNILFYKEAGYFDRTSEEKPLLHTWSLAVEEQFYIIIPALFALIYFFLKTNARNAVTWLTAGVTVISFALAVLALSWDASAVFYLFPFRAWELAIGVLLATGVAPKINSALMGNIVSGLGAVAIAVPIIFYTSATPFPGLTALLPCLGAALIIYSGEGRETLVGQALSFKLMVWIGLVSYSMYLWHWPVIVLADQGLFSERTFGSTVILILMIGGFTYLSYRFVETPVRKAKAILPMGRLFAGAGALSALLVAIGLGLHVTEGVPNRLSPQAKEFVEASTDFRHAMTDCRGGDNERLPGVPNCLIGDPRAKPSMLVWGDSHVLAFHDGIDRAMRDAKVGGLYVQATGCPPLFGIGKDELQRPNRQDAACAATNKKMEAYLSGEVFDGYTDVLLVGRWAYYVNGRGVGADLKNKVVLQPFDERLPDEGEFDVFKRVLERTVAALQKQGRTVTILEQPPELMNYLPRKISLQLMRGDGDFEAIKAAATVSVAEVEERQGAVNSVFADLEERSLITFLKTHHQFCDEDKCSAFSGDRPRMIDNNHVTVATSIVSVPIFASMFEE